MEIYYEKATVHKHILDSIFKNQNFKALNVEVIFSKYLGFEIIDEDALSNSHKAIAKIFIDMYLDLADFNI